MSVGTGGVVVIGVVAGSGVVVGTVLNTVSICVL